ncbi:MAG: hypothetical protein ACPG9G_05650, partial [Candidatus Thalassarchaeaceae archaeon]
MAAVMVAAMPLQNDARPSEKTVTLRDIRRVAFGLTAAIMIVMIAGAINDDSGSSTATAELGEEQVANYVFSINSGQSASLAENTAASTAVMTVAVTDGPATGCSISNGATDVDADGNAPFAISSSCAITVNDAGDLDYETLTSFTLSILATDSSGAADVGTVTISVTDVNDQTPAVTVDATYNHAEAAATTFQTYTIVDSDTSGTYTCTLGGDDAGDFSASISGKVCTVTWAANPDYETPTDADTDNVYDITIAFSDGTNNLAAQTTAITVTDVNDEAPVFTSATSANVAEGATAVLTLAATDGDAADSGGLTYAVHTDDPGTGTIFTVTGTALTIAAQDYESPACGGSSDSLTCVVIVSATDAAGTATQQTITVTITDVNDQTPAVTVAATSNHAEAAAT